MKLKKSSKTFRIDLLGMSEAEAGSIHHIQNIENKIDSILERLEKLEQKVNSFDTDDFKGLD